MSNKDLRTPEERMMPGYHVVGAPVMRAGNKIVMPMMFIHPPGISKTTIEAMTSKWYTFISSGHINFNTLECVGSDGRDAEDTELLKILMGCGSYGFSEQKYTETLELMEKITIDELGTDLVDLIKKVVQNELGKSDDEPKKDRLRTPAGMTSKKPTMNVKCPTCEAEPGDHCTTPAGKKSPMHKSRC